MSSSSDEDFGPAIPLQVGTSQDRQALFPIRNELKLNGHSKFVTAVALDPSGSRMLTGSSDCTVKFWDFAGMDRSLQYFRSMEPFPGNPIRKLCFNESGSHFLALSSDPQPILFSREGIELCQLARGDMYLHDLKLTKGHTTSCTTGEWHPSNPSNIITASLDSTIRIWDIENPNENVSILRSTTKGTGRLQIQSCSSSSDGRIIAGACSDGTIQLWQYKAKSFRPFKCIRNAHEMGTFTSDLKFSLDDRSFFSRGGDGTLKSWDMRSLMAPVMVWSDLPNAHEETNIQFFQDDRYIVTGTSDVSKISRQSSVLSGKLVAVDRFSGDIVMETALSGLSVISVDCHPILNQIIAGCDDSTCRVLYDPEISRNGALLCADKAEKKRSVDQLQNPVHILTPNSLPMFEDGPSYKKAKQKARMDPKAASIPERPLEGRGKGGRISSQNYNKFLAQSFYQDIDINEDPREAILKHATKEEKNKK